MKKKRVFTLDDYKNLGVRRAIVRLKSKWFSPSGSTIEMASLNSSMQSPPYIKYLWCKFKHALGL